MRGWWKRLRLRALRKAKAIRQERHQLAIQYGDFEGAAEHRRAIADCMRRIQEVLRS